MTLSLKKKITGWIFIVVGTIGFFLPIFPGTIFLLIGVTILGYKKPKLWLQKQINKIKRR